MVGSHCWHCPELHATARGTWRACRNHCSETPVLGVLTAWCPPGRRSLPRCIGVGGCHKTLPMPALSTLVPHPARMRVPSCPFRPLGRQQSGTPTRGQPSTDEDEELDNELLPSKPGTHRGQGGDLRAANTEGNETAGQCSHRQCWGLRRCVPAPRCRAGLDRRDAARAMKAAKRGKSYHNCRYPLCAEMRRHCFTFVISSRRTDDEGSLP